MEGNEKLDLFSLFEAQRWLCGWCGEKINPLIPGNLPDGLQVDHKKPLAGGGVHCRDNVQPMHGRCNKEKFSKVDHRRTHSSAHRRAEQYDRQYHSMLNRVLYRVMYRKPKVGWRHKDYMTFEGASSFAEKQYALGEVKIIKVVEQAEDLTRTYLAESKIQRG